MGAAARGDRVQFQQSRRNARPSKGPTADAMFFSSPISLRHTPASPRLLFYGANVFHVRPYGSVIHTYNCWKQAGTVAGIISG